MSCEQYWGFNMEMLEYKKSNLRQDASSTILSLLAVTIIWLGFELHDQIVMTYIITIFLSLCIVIWLGSSLLTVRKVLYDKQTLRFTYAFGYCRTYDVKNIKKVEYQSRIPSKSFEKLEGVVKPLAWSELKKSDKNIENHWVYIIVHFYNQKSISRALIGSKGLDFVQKISSEFN